MDIVDNEMKLFMMKGGIGRYKMRVCVWSIMCEYTKRSTNTLMQSATVLRR